MTILIQNARPQGFSDVAGASVDVQVGDDGTIAAVGNGLVAPAGARVIDGTGKTLSPGWMDLHVHVWHGGADIAVRPREAGLATGVTTMLDTGSAGEFAGDEVLDVKQVGARAVGDTHQRCHRRDLFDLLLEEPLHELLAEVVTLLAGNTGEPADLFGDGALLAERKCERVPGGLEAVAHRINTGDLGVDIPVEQVLDQHHGVVALFDRLRVEVLGELRKVGTVEIDRNCDVLL